jgi:type IV secretory pathway TrbL component
MQVIAIAARRLVVPALFAGITALGITGFASDAAARDTTPRMMASRSMPSHTAAHAATFRTAGPQASSARTTGAASGTYSQRSGATGGTATVSSNQLKRYSRFNESRH